MFCNKTSFYREEFSTPRPTPKLEDHTLSAVLDCLFNIFAATLHMGSRSSIRNLRTRHTMVTGTQLSQVLQLPGYLFYKHFSNCKQNARITARHNKYFVIN
jgi:hypothetical protein